MAVTLNYSWQNVAGHDVSFGSGAKISFWIDAKLNSQNSTTNKSVVDTRLTTTIYGQASGSGYSFWLTGSNGTSGSTVWTYENETVLTGQVTITHNADGRKSSTLSGGASNSYLGFNFNFSGDIVLPRIPKAPTTSSLSSTNLTRNSVDLSFTVIDNGGANITSASISLYEDSNLTQLKETKNGMSSTFGGLKSNRSYWAIGTAINSAGSGNTPKLQIDLEGSIIRIFLDGEWKDALLYVKSQDEWKELMPYIKVNDEWKDGI